MQRVFTFNHLLLIVLLLAAIIRFYRLPEMANFDFDQEYASNFAYLIFNEYPLRFIGQGLSMDGLYMGPWYFYFLTPFFYLFGLHPLGGFVGSVVVGLITVLIYFWVGKEFFGVRAGLIAAGLRAFLFSKIEVDWTMVPAFHVDGMVLLTWICFYKYWQGKTLYLVPLGLLFGLYTSIHPILFPFYIVFLVLLVIKRKLPDLKTTLLSIMGFTLAILPLIIFEFLHSFLEIKKLISLFSGGGPESGKNLSQLLYFIQYNLSEPFRVLGISSELLQLSSLIFLGSFIYLTVKKYLFLKDKFHLLFYLLSFVVFTVYYYLSPTHVPEYYFLAVTTLSLFYISGLLSLMLQKPSTKVILIGVFLYLLVVNFQSLRTKWDNPSLITLYHKDAVVREILKHQSNDKYFISYIKEPGWNFGFDYLFKYYGNYPDYKRAEPPTYTIVIPKGLSGTEADFSSGNIRLILPK